MMLSQENNKKHEVKKRNEDLKKENSLTPRSKFRFIRQKFKNSDGEKIVRISSLNSQPLRKKEKAEQLTPSVVSSRKLAEKRVSAWPFSDHILSNKDIKSDGTNGRPMGKRKLSDQILNNFSGETAHFSPSKRQKTKNCPNFIEFSDRLGSYPVRGNLEDADRGQKGNF